MGSHTAVLQSQRGEGLGGSTQKEHRVQRILYLENWLEMMQELLPGVSLCSHGFLPKQGSVPTPRAVWIPAEGLA